MLRPMKSREGEEGRDEEEGTKTEKREPSLSS